MKFISTGVLLLIFFGGLSSCGITKDDVEDSRQKVHSVFKTSHGRSRYMNAYDKTLASLWGVPYEEKNISTRFGKTHVIISGPLSAPPLILLHGMNASSTMWYPNAKQFSKNNRVYCIDFILEPGKSASNGEIKKTEDLVKWYDEVFDELKLEKFAVAGESRGGWLAVQLALHSKKKISKIALLSPAQTFTWIKPKKEIFKNILFDLFPKRQRLRSVMQTLTCDVDNLSQLYIDQYYLAVTQTKKNKSIFQVRPYTDEELKSLRLPVLVLIGETDIINNEEGLKRAQNLISGASVHIIPKAGHFVSFDKPEIVNKLVIQFLL